jgi:hypothetical protein
MTREAGDAVMSATEGPDGKFSIKIRFTKKTLKKYGWYHDLRRGREIRLTATFHPDQPGLQKLSFRPARPSDAPEVTAIIRLRSDLTGEVVFTHLTCEGSAAKADFPDYVISTTHTDDDTGITEHRYTNGSLRFIIPAPLLKEPLGVYEDLVADREVLLTLVEANEETVSFRRTMPEDDPKTAGLLSLRDDGQGEVTFSPPPTNPAQPKPRDTPP